MEILVHFDRHARQHFVRRSRLGGSPGLQSGGADLRPAEVATTHTEALALVLRLPKAAIAVISSSLPPTQSPATSPAPPFRTNFASPLNATRPALSDSALPPT